MLKHLFLAREFVLRGVPVLLMHQKLRVEHGAVLTRPFGLLALLRVLAGIPRIKTATLIKEVERWAPWMPASERSQMIDTALRTPRAGTPK